MGQANIVKMIQDLYDRLWVSSIASMFRRNQGEAVQRSADFFVTLLGGPPLFAQRYGSPMMRRRHFPFAIDEAGRQVWLKCFTDVLAEGSEKYAFPEDHLLGFIQFLDAFSCWMVNVAPSTAEVKSNGC